MATSIKSKLPNLSTAETIAKIISEFNFDNAFDLQTGLNYFYTSCHTKVKKPSLPLYMGMYSCGGEHRHGQHFLKYINSGKSK